MRSTSSEALRAVTESGFIAASQKEVYGCLFERGPLSSREVDVALGKSGHWKRLSELAAMGIVGEAGSKKCPVTGRRVILWDVTDRLPVKVERCRPGKNDAKQIIEDLRQEVAALKRKLARWGRPTNKWQAERRASGQPTLFA